jgi:D-3-phosphoglycerate dehydrogenase
MSKYLIVVTDDRFGSYAEEEEVLNEIDAFLKVYNCTDEEEVIEAVHDADGVLVNLCPLSSDVIKEMKKCRVISRYGVGYDNIDINAATHAGIWVTRVPDYAIEDVSDHTLALLLGCVRKISYKDRKIRNGKWNLHKNQPVYRIKGKVLGLIGFGAIARALKRKVSGFGLSKVLVYDPFVDSSIITKEAACPVDFNTLLRESDYISIHVPLTDETKWMISDKEISVMKSNVILVNTSRGLVLNERLVCEALQSGRIGYAGLDVFEQEPLPDDSPLRKMDNVILSDHSGWYSGEAIVELKKKAAKNIVEVLGGKKPSYPVNKI